MYADKLLNATLRLMDALTTGKADRALLCLWAEEMISIAEGVNALENTPIPDAMRRAGTGPNIIDLAYVKRLRALRPPVNLTGKPL